MLQGENQKLMNHKATQTNDDTDEEYASVHHPQASINK